MSTEVRTYLGNLNPKSPYFPFIRERNGCIAEKIAQYTGFKYNDLPLMDGAISEKTYIVPGATIASDLSRLLLIETENDFYGTSSPTLDHVGKALLHTTSSINPPEFYNPEFANQVQNQGLVLPGYTAFSTKDIQQIFGSFRKQNGLYRLKEPNESDGNGQYLIQNATHLGQILAGLSEDRVSNQGLVIEPNLSDKITISSGMFKLGMDKYVFVASQLNGINGERDVYLGGTNILVARGGFNELTDIMQHIGDERVESVQKAGAFLKLYLEYFGTTIASRISVDVLSGIHPDFGQVSGVTDITGRLGGLCPATIISALHLQENPDREAVESQVNLNYNPTKRQSYEEGATIFMDQQPLRISAKIDKVY